MSTDHRTVFISYAAADEPWAVWVAWQLEQAGYQPRLQAWHVAPGHNHVGWTIQELTAASSVVVILSPAYLRSELPRAELTAALVDAVSGRQLLVPVRVAACESPPLLREIARISLVDRGEADAHRVLIEGMRAAVGGEPIPPTVAPVFPGGNGQVRGQLAPPFPGPDREALTAQLLGLAEEACQLRHPEATIRRGRLRGPFGYLNVAGQRDGERQRWPVGVSIDSPDVAAVEAFYEAVVEPVFLPVDEFVGSELVHLGRPADEEAHRQARRRRIRLFTLAEYEGRWDPRRYVSRQTQRLTDDPAYPPGLYVPQRFTVAGSGTDSLIAVRGDQPDVQDDVFAAMRDWLDVEEARFLLVLGAFGHGKSFLLRELARRIPKELPQVVPMLVELRTLEKTHSIDELLALHLSKEGEHGVDVRKVRRRVEQGQVVLLFDGFDELALRVTYDNAAEYLRMVLSAVTGRAKVVLTSRTQHFLTDSQHRTELGAAVRLGAGSREIHLADFDRAQIRQFLIRLFRRQVAAETEGGGAVRTEEETWAEATRRAESRLALIGSIDDLLGLSANPRMLGFIADLDEQDLLNAHAADGTITSADLYAKLLERWLRHEVARRRPTRGAHQALDADQLRLAVDALAVFLWESRQDTTDLAGLSMTVQATLTGLGAAKIETGQAVFMVGSGSLLMRTNDNTFSFVHRSIMEYLVAAQAAAQLARADNEPDPELLAGREMSELMIDFLHGVASHTPLQRWARSILADGSDATDAARNNALRIARRTNLTIDGVQLAGQDLRGKDLTGQNLRFADLSRANLSGTRLHDSDLTGANLTGANLTGALLIRPTLIGARLTRSLWTGSALLDPLLDPEAEQCPELAPAAITGRDSVDLMVLPASPAITCAAVTHDGLLAVGWGQTVALVEMATLRPLRLLTGHRGGVLTLVFSPDGATLATSDRDSGVVHLWDVATGQPTRTLNGHHGGVQAAMFSPDGTTLATSDRDSDSDSGGVVVHLWDVATGQPTRTLTLTGHHSRVTAVVFSPDGTTLATSNRDSDSGGVVVRLWDVVTGQHFGNLIDDHGGLQVVAFSSDGTTLATSNRDRDGVVVRLWDVATGQPMRTLTLNGHHGDIQAAVFSPDGTTLATSNRDRDRHRVVVRLWDVATGQPTQTLNSYHGDIQAVVFSPDGTTLATSDRDSDSDRVVVVRLWDVATGQPMRTLNGHDSWVTAVVFSPDGTTLATTDRDSDRVAVRLWDVATGQPMRTLNGHDSDMQAVVFSPDGATLATTDRDSDSGGVVVRLWDVATGKPARTLTGHRGDVQAVVFSPDGITLATTDYYLDSDRDRVAVRLWDVATGQPTRTLTLNGHPSWVTAMVFSPDGTTLATSDRDRVAVRLWDVATGQPTRTLTGHHSWVTAVVFSPDGTTLATSNYYHDSDSGEVRLWDVATGQPTRTLTGHHSWVTAVAFSPDGTTLATSDNDRDGVVVRLWDVATGQPTRTLTGHHDGVTAVAFSPDGTTLATSDSAGARLWTADSGTLLATLMSTRSGWVTVLPDGAYKSSGDTDSRLWWAVKLRRFEIDELDGVASIRRLEPADPIPGLEHVPRSTVLPRDRSRRRMFPWSRRR